jgi:hypothetical protein
LGPGGCAPVGSVSEARPVQVHAGLDLEGPALQVNRALGLRLRGTALDASGVAVRGRAVQIRGIEATGFPVMPRVTGVLRSGAFEFLNVSPGEYEISLQGPLQPPIPALLGLGPRSGGPPTPGSASLAVRVGDSSPLPVTLRVVP